MADPEDGLLAIEIDADDYAEAAATDAPPVSRTYQSEEEFLAHKANYSAKIDGGNAYRDLIAAVPVLANKSEENTRATIATNGHTRTRLSKKDIQLLGYAVGELYYDEQYHRILDLCERLRNFCDVDEKTRESLDRWSARSRDRLSR